MCAGSKRESHSQVEGLARCLALIALAAAQLPSAAALAQSDSATPAGSRCAPRQLIVVELQRGWRCTVMLKADDAFVVQVDQRDVDVIVALEDERGHEVVAVDSPSKRASPEILLAGPRLTGQHALIVRARAGSRDAQHASMIMDRTTGSAASFAGLAQLTRASAPDELYTVQSGKERIAQLQLALASFHSADAKKWQAETLLRIAATYCWIVYDYEAAASTAQLAMEMLSQLADPVLHAQVAIIHAAAVIEIAAGVKAPARRARADDVQSPLDKAVSQLTSAALALQKAGLRHGQAEALNFAGVGLFHQGKYSDARARYDQAAVIFRSLEDAANAALPLQNIAHIDFDSGDYATAIASFKSALAVLDPVTDAGQYATVLINLGTAQYVMGHFEAALRSLSTAFETCQERGFISEQARSLHGLGMVYLVIGDRDRAQLFLERALELRRPLASQDPRSLQTSLIRVGDLRRERGDIRGALDLHQQALTAALSPSQRAGAFYALGRDHEANGAVAAAAHAYKAGLQLDLPEDLPIRVALMGAYGSVRMQAADDTGRALVERAAQLHEAHGDVERAAENYILLAEADRQQQQLASALRNAGKAAVLYESQRLRAVNPDLRATYLAARAEAAELLVEIHLMSADRVANVRERQRLTEAALLALETSRERALQDFRGLADRSTGQSSGSLAALDAQLSAKRHRLATLLDQQNPRADMIAVLRRDVGLLRTQIDIAQTQPATREQTSLERRTPTSVTEIQRTLQPRETVLVYQLGDRQSRLWAVTRESISATPLGGRARVEAAARALYEMWSTPVAPADAARELASSRVILGETTPWLNRGGTLVIVADGILRSLPFGALPVAAADGARVRVASTHEVVFRPTLRSAGNMIDVAAEPGNRILLVGDPTAPSRPSTANSAIAVDPWALPALPGSRREIQGIAALAAGWRSYVLLGAEATKPALLSMPLDTFRAIHFATHARLDVQDPQLSSIALSSRTESSAAASSMLTVREIVGFRLSAETVVLSACEASLGKSYRSQLSFGLSEAFLLAGAQNVLGSLWRVSDDAAQEYMQLFYRAYVSSDEKPAAAARLAALEMSRHPQFSHPYFWAAFALTQR